VGKESYFKVEFSNQIWARELGGNPAFQVDEELVEDENWGKYQVFHAYVPASRVAALARFLVQHQNDGRVEPEEIHHESVTEIRPDGTTRRHRLEWGEGSGHSPEAYIVEQLLGSASNG